MKMTVTRDTTGVVLIGIDGQVVKTYYPNAGDKPVIELLEDMARADELTFDMPKLKEENNVNLTMIREAAGYTLEQVAERVGCTRQTISKIELGLSIPRLDLALKLADVLNTDIKNILVQKRTESNENV